MKHARKLKVESGTRATRCALASVFGFERNTTRAKLAWRGGAANIKHDNY